MVWPAIIAGAAALGGGIMNSIGQSNANAQARDLANQNIALQREFATTGLQWRANDAMKAYEATGIHPLQLLGGGGQSFSPVSAAFVPETGIGEGLGRAGQDIARHLQAGSDREVRQAALDMQKSVMANTVERGALENQLLRMQIASEQARTAQTGRLPAPPRAGDPENKVMFPGVEPNIHADVSVVRTPRGGYVVLPSEQAQQRMSEMFGLSSEWFSRNRAWLATEEARGWVRKFLPPPPAGSDWRYHVPTGEWLPSYADTRANYPDRHIGRQNNDFYQRAAPGVYVPRPLMDSGYGTYRR